MHYRFRGRSYSRPLLNFSGLLLAAAAIALPLKTKRSAAVVMAIQSDQVRESPERTRAFGSQWHEAIRMGWPCATLRAR